MKIYVMRHGRTDDNVKGIFNGHNDEDINEIGIAQAKEAEKEVSRLDIDLIVCSTMLRARHTAEIVNTRGLPICYDERLIERDTGELTGKSVEEIDRENYWNYFSTKYKVELVPELCKRVYPVIDEIREKFKEKNILIVTHNGVARTIYSYFNGVPDDGFMLNRGAHKNCQIREYEI